jgi:hypothetical protein
MRKQRIVRRAKTMAVKELPMPIVSHGNRLPDCFSKFSRSVSSFVVSPFSNSEHEMRRVRISPNRISSFLTSFKTENKNIK